MDAVLEAGIEMIVAIQAAGSPAADGFFNVVTDLGGRHYLFLVPFLIWCVDFRLGVRVCVAMAATLFLNTSIKEWIGQPRPFQFDERVISAGEEGFGLPSGHAQLVVIYWGLLADWIDRRGFWLFAVTVMLTMGFSRVYLGVHFPSDVVVGWAIGALTLWLIVARQAAWSAQLAAWPASRVALGVLATAALLFLFDAVAVHDHSRLNPGSLGFFAGSAIGGLLSLRRNAFGGAGPVWQRALRFLVGIIGALMLLGLAQRLGVPESDFAARVVVGADLFIFGLWLTGGAPRLFELLRLADEPAAMPGTAA